MSPKTTYYVQWAGAAAVAAGFGSLLWRQEVKTFAAFVVGLLLIWLGGFLRARKLL
jgi:hypothetical protein